MFIPKENFLDRIEQSFLFLKNDFLKISILYIGFSLISGFIMKTFGTLAVLLGMKYVKIDNLNMDMNLYIKIIYFGIIYALFAFSIFLIKIPFFISLIRNLKQLYNNEKIDVAENIKYGFRKIWDLFNTYWYVYKYVGLIPSLILIIGLIAFIINKILGGFIISFAIILLIYFTIFRGIKSFFSVIYATFYDKYDVENFQTSIFITKNKLGKIFWNIVGISILISLIGSAISLILSIFGIFGGGLDYSSIMSLASNQDNELVKEKLTELIKTLTPTNYSIIIGFIKSSVENLIDSIFYIFTITFEIILFKRLEIEKNISNDELITINK